MSPLVMKFFFSPKLVSKSVFLEVLSFQDTKVPEFCNHTVNGTCLSMNLNFSVEVGEQKGLREFMYIPKAFCSPRNKFLDPPLAIERSSQA